jgi:hypothetical protein
MQVFPLPRKIIKQFVEVFFGVENMRLVEKLLWLGKRFVNPR